MTKKNLKGIIIEIKPTPQKKLYETLKILSLSFIGTVQGIILFIAIFGFLISGSLYGQNIFMQPYHQLISNNFKSDSLIKEISNLCKNNTTIYEAECIHTYVDNNFNYNLTNTRFIKHPKEIIKSGGYCQEWSVFYAAILKNLNWNIQFIYIPGHVYVMGCKNDTCCNFDQAKDIICLKVKK